MATVKPTIINQRKTVIGNLVFLTGELEMPDTANGGFDFSDHVKRILSFDFIVGARFPAGATATFEHMDTHADLKNSSNARVRRVAHVPNYHHLTVGAKQGLLSENILRIVTAGEGYTNGSSSNVVLTGADSGANDARATVVANIEGAITSVTVTDGGTGYFAFEKLNVAGGFGGQVIAQPAALSNAQFTSDTEMNMSFFPILTNKENVVKIVNMFSDDGMGGDVFTDSDALLRTCEFTLIGKR